MTGCTSEEEREGPIHPSNFSSLFHRHRFPSLRTRLRVCRRLFYFTPHTPTHSRGLQRPLRLEVEGELPLLVEAGAAHLHREASHPGAAAVQTQVAAHVAKLRVGLDLLPFLRTNNDIVV